METYEQTETFNSSEHYEWIESLSSEDEYDSNQTGNCGRTERKLSI